MAMMPSPGRPPKFPPSPSSPTPTPSLDADRLRLWSEPGSGSAAGPSSAASALEAVLEEFTRRWDRGEDPRAEDFLDRLPPDDPDTILELIYHEFCLLASSGRRPSPDDLTRRFPSYRDRLLRLIALHDALPPLGDDAPEAPALPEPGDDIGPYRLLREIGRGGFARVFLAADAELEDRLLVLKVTDRPSAEHRYLARAPHPHIVPILRERTTEDGLQLIFMPFSGGTTLGEVLAEGRMRARRPERGVDLLTALDLRSAPEYDAAAPGRPAREILATLSYPQAVAWLVARLAEGLDHAYRRGVTHGDLKPSNILIGGDGQPMLLDFNLSTDWQPATPSTASSDPGGTLAYMAPERLRAIAEPELATPPCPVARHRADLYALGLILREALTGTPPHVPTPSSAPRSGRALAAQLAAERSSGDPTSRPLLASVPPGLRVILRSCLAPAPSDRYAHASHLAADLDRWRTGLPLIYATPPRWVEAARWARFHRRPLLAAALSVAFGLLCTGVASAYRDTSSKYEQSILEKLQEKVESYWSDAESGAYPIWNSRPNQITSHKGRVEFAEQALQAFGMFDEASADVWERAEMDLLDETDRFDLQAWLLEQVLLYGLEVTDPRYAPFPEDRRKALALIDRLTRNHALSALEETASLLRTQLGQPEAIRPSESHKASSSWLEHYLWGVRAEAIQPDQAHAMGLNPKDIGFEVAVDHYTAALAERPQLYWPRYRLSVASARLGNLDVADRNYRICIERRPKNAVLWLSRGTCEISQGSTSEAIGSYRRAIELAPRWPVVWRNLALLGARLRDRELCEEAIGRFRLRDNGSEADSWRTLRLDLALIAGAELAPITGNQADGISDLLSWEAEDEGADLGVRYDVALELQKAGRFDEALNHYSRILKIDPDHIKSRFNRAIIHQTQGRPDEALEDYRTVAADPKVGTFISSDPTGLMIFILLSADQIRNGRAGEATALAEVASKFAERTGHYRGEAAYALARAHAAAADADPFRLKESAKALAKARDYSPGFIEQRFHSDPLFATQRAELAELLGGVGF